MIFPHPLRSGLILAALVGLTGARPRNESRPTADPDPAVQKEMDRGRFWHASKLMDEGAASGGVLVRARAEAGWGNWPEVWRLLETVSGVDSTGRTRAWALRGRAAEEGGRDAEAALSYRRALEDTTALDPGSSLVLRARLARTLAARDSFAEAVDVVREVSRVDPWAGSWLALEVARSAAEEGRFDETETLVERITAPSARRRSWSLVGKARVAAGDTAGAIAAYQRVAEGDSPREVKSSAWSRVGELERATGDSASAVRAFRTALAEMPDARAAAGLVAMGLETSDEALRAYRALRVPGREADALSALDRFAELKGTHLPDTLRLDRARLLSKSGRRSDAIKELRGLASSDSADIAAPALNLWANVRRAQGRRSDARTLQDRLVRRFPTRPEAVSVVFYRGDDREDHHDFSGAMSDYRKAVEMDPSLDLSGLARMRMGQIHLTRGERKEAAQVFEAYLDAFPNGRRWEEASYWAAFTDRALGQKERARAHVERIRKYDPLSYYAVLGSHLLGESFDPDIPEGVEPPKVPAIGRALDRIQILRQAGLEDGVPGEIAELRRRYQSSQDTLLRLSLELSRRGLSLDGIGLAWDLHDRGMPWSRWLARAVYPFPYRELVRLEAEEWGLEPTDVAALIRQESAFLADARSGAGAVGLMQVVPSTGRRLARSVGPEPFTDGVLLRPELNLHLGVAFLSHLEDRFGDGPLVLAAYNAGPNRADQWKKGFPESDEPLRFTERIPYRETRQYVKGVTRNEDVYRWLYGKEVGE